jgi:hypothetical protein
MNKQEIYNLANKFADESGMSDKGEVSWSFRANRLNLFVAEVELKHDKKMMRSQPLTTNEPLMVKDLTMRDYFAAKALQGLMVDEMSGLQITREAYYMADAMLKERGK